jgi:hypothetical protein
MELTLSPNEQKLLVQLLERTLGDLRIEVRRTRAPSFRDPLQDEEKLLIGLLERLKPFHED